MVKRTIVAWHTFVKVQCFSFWLSHKHDKDLFVCDSRRRFLQQFEKHWLAKSTCPATFTGLAIAKSIQHETDNVCRSCVTFPFSVWVRWTCIAMCFCKSLGSNSPELQLPAFSPFVHFKVVGENLNPVLNPVTHGVKNFTHTWWGKRIPPPPPLRYLSHFSTHGH